eukprot:6178799-Pleurochrysis_carterae.AAC.1
MSLAWRHWGKRNRTCCQQASLCKEGRTAIQPLAKRFLASQFDVSFAAMGCANLEGQTGCAMSSEAGRAYSELAGSTSHGSSAKFC